MVTQSYTICYKIIRLILPTVAESNGRSSKTQAQSFKDEALGTTQELLPDVEVQTSIARSCTKSKTHFEFCTFQVTSSSLCNKIILNAMKTNLFVCTMHNSTHFITNSVQKSCRKHWFCKKYEMKNLLVRACISKVAVTLQVSWS